MSFQKILCPTDFSAGARQAMRAAIRIANEADAELVLVHAWYVPPSMYAGEYIFPPNVLGDMQAEMERGLDEQVREAVAAGARKVRGKLVTGVPWAQIVDLLEAEHFDLCVMGTHGRTGLARVLLGSVAEKVIRHAHCPVLAVRPDGEVGPFVHVLVPTDFSEAANHAAALAAKLVEPDGELTLLHVIEVPVAYSGDMPVADFARDLDRRSAEALDAAAARAKASASVRVTTRSRIGYAGAQTLAAIDADPTIDLVVMGSHGRTGIKRALMGSVAEKVVRHARCAVLVVR